ncbi:hypothetical protein F0L68_05340, partial [Solihabitans fulvus]
MRPEPTVHVAAFTNWMDAHRAEWLAAEAELTVWGGEAEPADQDSMVMFRLDGPSVLAQVTLARIFRA